MMDLALHRLILTVAEEMRARGSWAGETHIQKVGYFLQELLGVPLQAEYILYKHGPYSFDLKRTLTFMRAYRFVDWEARAAKYGPSLVAGDQAGTLTRFTTEPEAYLSRIRFAAEQLATKRVTELERLATALFVTLDRTNEGGDRAARIHELKPHVTPVEAHAAVAELDAMVDQARSAGWVVENLTAA